MKRKFSIKIFKIQKEKNCYLLKSKFTTKDLINS